MASFRDVLQAEIARQRATLSAASGDLRTLILRRIELMQELLELQPEWTP